MFYVFSFIEEFENGLSTRLFCLIWVSTNYIPHGLNKLSIVHRSIGKEKRVEKDISFSKEEGLQIHDLEKNSFEISWNLQDM